MRVRSCLDLSAPQEGDQEICETEIPYLRVFRYDNSDDLNRVQERLTLCIENEMRVYASRLPGGMSRITEHIHQAKQPICSDRKNRNILCLCLLLIGAPAMF